MKSLVRAATLGVGAIFASSFWLSVSEAAIIRGEYRGFLDLEEIERTGNASNLLSSVQNASVYIAFQYDTAIAPVGADLSGTGSYDALTADNNTQPLWLRVTDIEIGGRVIDVNGLYNNPNTVWGTYVAVLNDYTNCGGECDAFLLSGSWVLDTPNYTTRMEFFSGVNSGQQEFPFSGSSLPEYLDTNITPAGGSSFNFYTNTVYKNPPSGSPDFYYYGERGGLLPYNDVVFQSLYINRVSEPAALGLFGLGLAGLGIVARGRWISQHAGVG